MKDLKLTQHVALNKVFHQFLLNMLGKSDDPETLVGDVLDAAELKEMLAREGMYGACHHLYQGILHMYFGRHKEFAERILKFDGIYTLDKVSPIAIQVNMEPFVLANNTVCVCGNAGTIMRLFVRKRQLMSPVCRSKA